MDPNVNKKLRQGCRDKARRTCKEVREEAREEGIELGREENCRAIACNLLAKSSAPEFVHKITGLDMETIRGLSS